MYPNVPNDDMTWPVTQHAGVINREVIEKLLEACVRFNGKVVDSDSINRCIVESGILTENVRKDSNRVDAWRDYQQILSELGLIYSTRITRELILTPVAVEFLDGVISYEELMTMQLLRYQYPNGHKSQLSPNLRHRYVSEAGLESFTAVQASLGILLRPAVLVFEVLERLLACGENPVLTIDEMQTYLVRCLTHGDVEMCVYYIANARSDDKYRLNPMPRARRNMQDWIKLLVQTRIFATSNFKWITLSDYAIEHLAELKDICGGLSSPESFWIFKGEADYKFNWFAFYGSINMEYDWDRVPETECLGNSSDEDDNQAGISTSMSPSEIKLREYASARQSVSGEDGRQIISRYDYNKSRKGYYLHDSMVDFIARRCVSKGADVYEDGNSVDLFIRHDRREYLVEVKSVTSNNLIHRLRSAIGQVKQYDYLLPAKGERRLGVAFTADIPEQSWVIPFVTSHLDMDLLTMRSDGLSVWSNDRRSCDLFGD